MGAYRRSPHLPKNGTVWAQSLRAYHGKPRRCGGARALYARRRNQNAIYPEGGFRRAPRYFSKLDRSVAREPLASHWSDHDRRSTHPIAKVAQSRIVKILAIERGWPSWQSRGSRRISEASPETQCGWRHHVINIYIVSQSSPLPTFSPQLATYQATILARASRNSPG